MTLKMPLIFFAIAVLISPSSADLPKGALEIGDYNGDGIDDYLILDPERSKARNEPHFVFLSDKSTGKHRKLDIEVCNPKWDPGSKTLTSHSFGGGGRTYFHETYSLVGSAPILIMTVQRTEKNVKDAPGTLEFTVTTRKLINGEWATTVLKE